MSLYCDGCHCDPCECPKCGTAVTCPPPDEQFNEVMAKWKVDLIKLASARSRIEELETLLKRWEEDSHPWRNRGGFNLDDPDEVRGRTDAALARIEELEGALGKMAEQPCMCPREDDWVCVSCHARRALAQTQPETPKQQTVVASSDPEWDRAYDKLTKP